MTDTIMKTIDILRSNGGSVIVNKNLARSIGMDAAIMYSELVSKFHYFAEKGQLTDDGYFFNTVENMKVDTTLTDYQQRKALVKLVKLGLVQQVNRGTPQKRYFRLDCDEEHLKNIMAKGETNHYSKNS